MGEESGDKSEEPTPHKLSEARKKGQVLQSKEVTTAILLIVVYKVFAANAEKMWYRLLEFCDQMFKQIGMIGTTLDLGLAQALTSMGIQTIIITVLPVLLVGFIIPIIVTFVQTQFLFSSESMKPDLNKINPMSGLKRIFSAKGVVQILITLVKIILVAWVAWSVVRSHLEEIITSMTFDPFTLMLYVGGLVMEIATKIGFLYLVIALADYFYQKHEFKKSMMMTKQEVKEEYKRLEGDPTIKQAQRQKQREMSQRRQKGSVPGADVVVTNPIHLACAIRYKADIDKAPVLVAKGQRIFAQEIKDIAEEYNVPIVENERLARAIFDSTEVGQDIPPEMYRAVAEILAFVYKLGRNKRKQKDKPIVNQK